VDKLFQDHNDRSHFSQLSLRKGTDGLYLWIRGRGYF
jgi:hypothetical protein